MMLISRNLISGDHNYYFDKISFASSLAVINVVNVNNPLTYLSHIVSASFITLKEAINFTFQFPFYMTKPY